MHRITIPFDALVGKTVAAVEITPEDTLSMIITFTDGTTLYVDDPTVYGDGKGVEDEALGQQALVEMGVTGPPAPPEDLADAWDRFQSGGAGDVTQAELRKLDEWRADCREDALGW